ncbi:MAG TPA: hypothetical protein VJT32_13005 [bacterium]|nr:hypothetical protein [bacterium]
MPTGGRGVLVAAIGTLALMTGNSAGAQPLPAGTTAAILSIVDSAAGRVEVLRGWPQAPSEVDVYPFVPYFWGGCPGPGAIMMLVTGPAPAALADQVIQALRRHDAEPRSGEGEAIARIAAALRTPGDPALEALKVGSPWIGDLATYERWGYAVFLFVRWEGFRCTVTLRPVPEGYGIPFVR